MLVPKFSLEQSDACVFIAVHCPYSNVRDTEVLVEGREFAFSSSPYHLRLSLPGDIVENERSTAKYDCDTGRYEFVFEKVRRGERFVNLEMVTSLLAPQEAMPGINPDRIEVMGESGVRVEDEESGGAAEIRPRHGDVAFANRRFAYGFANALSGEFKSVGGEFSAVFELKAPEEMSPDERKRLMQEHENERFSSDHYLADYFDADLINPLLEYRPPWEATEARENSKFTDKERTLLKDLPNKEYLLTKDEYKSVIYNLVDILYAYCYEKRVTYNENNIESSWTINRISGTLSWFAVFTSMKDTMISCYRRALIYPIYRNFKLATQIQKDVEKLFSLGRMYIVKCLIEIYNLFNSSQDARYILNQLYIKDFLIFSQKCNEDTYREAYEELSNIVVEKDWLSLELDDYESAAELVQKEEAQILENAIALKMSSLNLHSANDSTSNIKNGALSIIDSDDSSDESSDDSSSSTTSDLDSDDDSDSS